ncbi:MAG: FAD-binding oxidoreductase, partial [Elusimicrobiales bacterium]
MEKAKEEILKICRVSCDELSNLIYSSDASMIKAKPAGVIHINDIDEISAVVRILYKNGVSFTPRCAGTNLSGGATNSKGGFIINLAQCRKIHQIDTQKQIAVVEPGVVNIHLQKELERFGFFYPPDPASQKVSTIGGNIGENAGGPRCIKYGVTLNNVHSLEIVLPDGTESFFSVDDYGPELINLFIGSEGTLGIIKKAYLKIFPIPSFSGVIYAEFHTLEDAMKSVEDIISSGIIPAAIEGLDRMTAELVLKKELDKKIEGMLIIEIDAYDKDEFLKQKQDIENIVNKRAVLIKFSDVKEEIEELFRIRKDAYPSLAKIANNILVEDGCVPRSVLSQAVKEIKEIISENGLKATLVFHAGDR